MSKVFVIVQEINGKLHQVYQAYSDESHCYQACADFAERYTESDWSYVSLDIINPMKGKDHGKA